MLERRPVGSPGNAPASLLAAVDRCSVVLASCGGEPVDATPEKLDGTASQGFEQDDFDAAAGASDGVKEYCSEAVSEAQRLGCEAHVTEDEIP